MEILDMEGSSEENPSGVGGVRPAPSQIGLLDSLKDTVWYV